MAAATANGPTARASRINDAYVIRQMKDTIMAVRFEMTGSQLSYRAEGDEISAVEAATIAAIDSLRTLDRICQILHLTNIRLDEIETDTRRIK
jgi:hypothetical protein